MHHHLIQIGQTFKIAFRSFKGPLKASLVRSTYSTVSVSLHSEIGPSSHSSRHTLCNMYMRASDIRIVRGGGEGRITLRGEEGKGMYLHLGKK